MDVMQTMQGPVTSLQPLVSAVRLNFGAAVRMPGYLSPGMTGAFTTGADMTKALLDG